MANNMCVVSYGPAKEFNACSLTQRLIFRHLNSSEIDERIATFFELYSS